MNPPEFFAEEYFDFGNSAQQRSAQACSTSRCYLCFCRFDLGAALPAGLFPVAFAFFDGPSLSKSCPPLRLASRPSRCGRGALGGQLDARGFAGFRCDSRSVFGSGHFLCGKRYSRATNNERSRYCCDEPYPLHGLPPLFGSWPPPVARILQLAAAKIAHRFRNATLCVPTFRRKVVPMLYLVEFILPSVCEQRGRGLDHRSAVEGATDSAHARRLVEGRFLLHFNRHTLRAGRPAY